jgi:hypothetical protein
LICGSALRIGDEADSIGERRHDQTVCRDPVVVTEGASLTQISWVAAQGLPRTTTRSSSGCVLRTPTAVLPEAYEVEGVLTGVLLVVGFAISVMLDAL